MNDYVFGLCPECQRIIKRRSPAELAVCEFCWRSPGNPPRAVEVELMPIEELERRIGKEVLRQLQRERKRR